MAFFSFLTNAYRGTSYQNKLLISYFVFFMIPLLFFAIFSYRQSSAVIIEQATKISDMYLQQAKTELNAQLTGMMSLSQQIARQKRIRAILEQPPLNLSISQQYDDLNEIDEMVQRTVFSTDIHDVRIYVDDDFLYSVRNLLTYPMSQLDEAGWFDRESLLISGAAFTPVYPYRYLTFGRTDVISALSLIRSSRDFATMTGLVSVDLKLETLLDVLQYVDFSAQGRAYIVNLQGQLICGLSSSDQRLLTDFIADDAHYLQHPGIVMHNQSVLSGLTDPGFGGWRILVVSPVRPLLASSARLRIQLVFFAVLVGIIVYFLAWFYARSNAGRIMGLVRKMRVVQSGNFDVNCVVDSADEIGELQSNFNMMIREIRLLLDEQYTLGQSLKDSELKVLQAQINPHFLYNTLDLILWTAKNNKPDEVCDIVINLSRFYRLSLSNGEALITIGDELEHVRLYVALQNLRFKKKIALILEAAPDVRQLRILKLLLQPIVENSILHGIQNLDDREGEIEIKAWRDEQSLVLAVSDNGIGIDRNEISRILLREPARRDRPDVGRFGLFNIRERLRVYYGDAARLDVASTPGKGTTIRMTIPLTILAERQERT
ncbi:MAG: sensor histidine kinase [Clostridiaceae bacterium]|nr:sensor histidine kinase [Clostridiaceae bacterium]